ncbi:uncharacterized protein LOC128155306 [Crassostrea angulata]|uniref:uncharacterized protein LOC128155306 n=1 Tax=Magallana angulata TaxID=2784310 RepID=UPI0022B0EB8A|nr:uncharacterized protein LOC128155306 [Crassostrea angulata]XP_052672908.1 uncharacterized protein LOC128155306 [Crassostrea angulata]
MDTVMARQEYNERQQQIEAKEGQRPQIRSRDEWAATLPTAWRQHVWSEKGTQLKESLTYFTNLLKGLQKNCYRLKRFADKREKTPKLRFISDINDEEYDALLSGMENEQIDFSFFTMLSKLKKNLDQLIEECATEKRIAITICENIADIEGRPRCVPLKAWHLLDDDSKQFVIRVNQGMGADETQLQHISQGLLSLMNMICRLQDENVALKRDVEFLCMKNMKIEKKKAGIEEELSSSKERINSLQCQLKTNTETQSQTLANYVRQLEKQVKELQQRNNTCEKKVDTLKMEKEALLTRLSEIAGTRLTSNNPGITDLSDEFRPLKLNDMFREMYDDKWTDAMEDLSSGGLQDKVAVTLLLQIVKEAFSLCKDSDLWLLWLPECQLLECVQESDPSQRKLHALDNKLTDEERTKLRKSTGALKRKHHKYLIQTCQEKLTSVVSKLIQRRMQLCTSSGSGDVYRGENNKLCEQHEQKGDFGKAVYKKAANPPETEYHNTPKRQKFTTGSNSLNISNAVGKENIPDRKANSARADFAKPIIDGHVTEPSEITLDNDKFSNVLNFARDVVEVCWWMRCTQPPVHLDFSIPVDGKFSPELYKAYTKSGQTIDYVVWPVMYLHEHGPLLSKGVAQPV